MTDRGWPRSPPRLLPAHIATVFIGMTGVAHHTVLAQPASYRLASTPVAASRTPFTLIGGVRELPDGRVIVLDVGERLLALVDLRTGTQGSIGRHGSGPGEYLLPSLLLHLPNGETGVRDPPNARVLVLSSTGAPVRGLPDRAPAAGGLEGVRVTGSDTLGRFYTRAQPAAPGPDGRLVVTDSAAIERWLPGSSRRDTVAFVPVTRPPDAVVVGGSVVSQAGAITPFAVAPQWAVGPDGRIAIVHPEPYRVDIVESQSRRGGVSISYTPIRVSEAHKRQWRGVRARPVFQTVYPGGGAPPVIRRITPRIQEPPRWPAVLPAITGEPPRFDHEGRIWIGRNTAAGAPARYDLFGREGRYIAEVILPPAMRLVGFGPGGVYLVRRDRDDLESLQRHPLPAEWR